MSKLPVASCQLPDYKKILIVRLDRIGDVMLSTPVVKNLRDAYPDSHIAFMVRPYASQIVEGNPYLDEVIVYDKDGSQKGLAGNIDFVRSLRSEKFDLAVILHPTKRAHLVTFFAGIPERVGYDKKWGFLLTKRVPHVKQQGLKHEIDYSLDLLRHIGIAPADRALYMPIKAESENKVKEIFAKNSIAPGDIVITLNPGASCPSKRWRPENFAKVASALSEKYKAKIVITADSKDKPSADKVSASMKSKPLDLSGQTSISDLASVLKRSRLFISNDSGPVHIACAVGTPVIAIFGRSDRGLSPERWGPSGKRDIVLHKDVGCEVCLAHNCVKGFKCLEAVTPEDVIAAADKILRK